MHHEFPSGPLPGEDLAGDRKGDPGPPLQAGRLEEEGRVLAHWQVGNLNDAMRVLQLKLPVYFRYSVVYQKVQSSIGSTLMAL